MVVSDRFEERHANYIGRKHFALAASGSNALAAAMMGAGAAHPAMNPFAMPQNAKCRRSYSKEMNAGSLEILNRTVMMPAHPLHTDEDIEDTVHNFGMAARAALGGMSVEEADFRGAAPVDVQNSISRSKE